MPCRHRLSELETHGLRWRRSRHARAFLGSVGVTLVAPKKANPRMGSCNCPVFASSSTSISAIRRWRACNPGSPEVRSTTMCRRIRPSITFNIALDAAPVANKISSRFKMNLCALAVAMVAHSKRPDAPFLDQADSFDLELTTEYSPSHRAPPVSSSTLTWCPRNRGKASRARHIRIPRGDSA